MTATHHVSTTANHKHSKVALTNHSGEDLFKSDQGCLHDRFNGGDKDEQLIPSTTCGASDENECKRCKCNFNCLFIKTVIHQH